MSNHITLTGVLCIRDQIFGSKKDKYQYLFRPFSCNVPPLLVWSKINRTREPSNIICLVEKISDPKGGKYGEGNLRLKIGNVHNLNDLKLGFLYHYGLIKQTKQIIIPTVEVREGEDHTDRKVYSVDPEGCQDIDDAFAFETDSDGSHKITIYIAEASNILQSDLRSDIFNVLTKQPFTLYLHPDSASSSDSGPSISTLRSRYDMLSKEAVAVYSLNPGVDRWTVALELNLTKNLEIESHRFLRAKINNRFAFCYETVDRQLKRESGQGSINWSQFREALQHINSKLQEDSIEPYTIDSHKMIEIMMLIYNKLACETLLKKDLAPILRVHQAPKTGSQLQSHILLPKFLEYESAKYALPEKGKSQGHYGLGMEYYGHFTSPLRRLVDLYNQLLLTQILEERACGQECQIVIQSLESINQYEVMMRKFYRRERLLTIAPKYATPVVTTVIPYLLEIKDKDQPSILDRLRGHLTYFTYQCYWSLEGLRIKLKSTEEITLYQNIEVKLAIIKTDLPRIRIVRNYEIL